jgi:hypothetical protein
MTYAYWHEKPEHTTRATVSRPDDLKALAKEFAGKCQENEYTADEHVTNIRLAGDKRRRACAMCIGNAPRFLSPR